MQWDAKLCAQLRSGSYVLDGAYFTLAVHQASEANRCDWFGDRYACVTVELPCDDAALFCRLFHRSMFDFAKQDGQVKSTQAAHGEIVGLGATRRKQHIFQRDKERRCDLLSCRLNLVARAAATGMQARRVAWAAMLDLEEAFEYARIHNRASVVIEEEVWRVYGTHQHPLRPMILV